MLLSSCSQPQPRHRHRNALCAVARPKKRSQSSFATATTVSIEERLNGLLRWLQFWQTADEDRLPESSRGAEEPLSRDGVLGLLRFWENNSANVQSFIRSTVSSLRAGSSGSYDEAGRHLDRALDIAPDLPRLSELEPQARNLGAFIGKSLTMWDFDRREPGVMFVNSWNEGKAEDEQKRFKVTSTIRYLHREWKLSARTKLMNLGSDENGAVFGKAGVYLAGDLPPYVGIEADRMLPIPKIARAFVFGNLNYRSSRKPFAPTVVGSAGIQYSFPFRKNVLLTLRAGWSSKDINKPFFLQPMAGEQYF